jgi:hypothetical protein
MKTMVCSSTCPHVKNALRFAVEDGDCCNVEGDPPVQAPLSAPRSIPGLRKKNRGLVVTGPVLSELVAEPCRAAAGLVLLLAVPTTDAQWEGGLLRPTVWSMGRCTGPRVYGCTLGPQSPLAFSTARSKASSPRILQLVCFGREGPVKA